MGELQKNNENNNFKRLYSGQTFFKQLVNISELYHRCRSCPPGWINDSQMMIKNLHEKAQTLLAVLCSLYKKEMLVALSGDEILPFYQYTCMLTNILTEQVDLDNESDAGSVISDIADDEGGFFFYEADNRPSDECLYVDPSAELF